MQTVDIEVRNSIMVCGIAACTSFLALPAHALVESLAAGAAAASVIDQLKSAANSVIQQLESTVGTNQFQIRQSLLVIQDELAYKAEELEGKTFADLNDTQRRFFVQTEAAINEAARATKAPLAQMQSITDSVNTAVSRLPMADRSPRVLQVRPGYVLQSQATKKLTLSISGSELNHGTPTLAFGSKPCDLASQSDASIHFQCDIGARKESLNVQTLTGEMKVALPRSFWQRVVGVFGGERPTKSYRAMVQLIPDSLGSYAVEVTRSERAQETAERSGVVDAANSHCDGERVHGPFIFTVVGGADWQIVPGSIREGGERSGNQQRSLNGPLEVTGKGFRYMAKLKNGGQCVKVAGFGADDARAWIKKDILWTEVRTVSNDTTSSAGSARLFWGKDIPISLPPDTKSFRVTVNQIDGAAPVVIAADNSQRWFRLDVDGDKRTVVIRPRSLEDALR